MSVALTIDDRELGDLQKLAIKLAGAIGGQDVRLVMGRALQQRVKQHFVDLASDGAHHRTAEQFGVAPTGFYLQAADRTQSPQLESGGVSVSVKQTGIAQRIFGGTIAPTNAKFLTIPARSEAVGHRAREFNNLKAIMFGPDRGALVQRDATVLKSSSAQTGLQAGASKGDSLGGGVFFWLVKSVTQKPDPSVAVTGDEVLPDVLANAQSYLERLWSKS